MTDVVRVFGLAVAESHRKDYPILTLDPYPHTLTVSFSLPHDAPVDDDDADALSVDFSVMCKALLKHAKRPEKFQSTEELVEELCRIAFETFDALREVVVTVEKSRASGGARDRWPRKVGVSARRRRDGAAGSDTILISGMDMDVLAGVHEWERREPSVVAADITLVCEPWQGGAPTDLSALIVALYDCVNNSDDLTLETLAASIARAALSYDRGSQHHSREATVKLTKLNAVLAVAPVEVEVTRTAAYFSLPRPPAHRPTHTPHTSVGSTSSTGRCIVVIALGSNLGDRYANMEHAMRQIEGRHEVISVTGTSFLYESDPMYFENQDKFLNCTITAETTLRPPELLKLLKHIEDVVGRVATRRNGPRAIDLDIVFYGSISLDTRKAGGDGCKDGELVIPHLRLREREFVLRPLNDIIPDFIHPSFKISVHALFTAHMATHRSTICKVLPFPAPPRQPHISTTLWPLSYRTYIMATINATPDSFSSTAPSTTDSAVMEALAAATGGADILDVGGYSTRPGAAPVSEDEELRRVVPVIRALRMHGVTLPISIDTFRPAVLHAAVEAGANCLNDVTALAGSEDDEHEHEGEMAAAVRELGVPVVMMHSRGAHKAGSDKVYGEEGVLAGVRRELGVRVRHALACGVRRWHIIVDPGFGFSKNVEGNAELLRRFRELTVTGPGEASTANSLEGFPTLAGLSRKSFLGKLLGRHTAPQEREWATGAAIAAAVQQGADVVRVHDVVAMEDVVKVADALWRV